jgi:hypothetical protein
MKASSPTKTFKILRIGFYSFWYLFQTTNALGTHHWKALNE